MQKVSGKRRTPLGTQPPEIETESEGAPQNEVSGVILVPRDPPEPAVFIETDDEWLDRLDLPAD